MKQKRPVPRKRPSTLRERAETAAQATRAARAHMSAEDIQRLAHELQVHAIELEMHNEELRESERTALAVVDGLTAHIAIVNASGRIIAVNARWREFAKRNGGSFIAVGEGANYLAACDRAARHNGCAAAELAAGIRKVLKGKLPEFSAEYPCPAPTEERWFIVRVTPIPGHGPRRALVSHENISERVLAEQAVRREQEFSERVIHTVQTIVLLLSPEGKNHPVQSALGGIVGLVAASGARPGLVRDVPPGTRPRAHPETVSPRAERPADAGEYQPHRHEEWA